MIGPTSALARLADPATSVVLVSMERLRVQNVLYPGPTELPPAAANPSTLRGKAFVVTHDELRFDLVDRVHRNAHHNQQRSATEIETHAQPVGHPGRKSFKHVPTHPNRQMVEMDARD